MNTKIQNKMLASLAAGLLCAASVGAQTVIVDNTAQATHGTSPVDVTTAQWEASKFSTDGSSYNQISVVLNLGNAFDTSGNFLVDIYNDNSGTPGSVLANLSGSANPASAGLFTYSAVPTVTLNANTAYWVVAKVSSGNGDYTWHFTSSTAQAGGAVGTVGGFSESLDQGASWSAEDTAFPSEFKVTGAAVPEPSTYATIFGLAALGFGAVSRRLRRA